MESKSKIWDQRYRTALTDRVYAGQAAIVLTENEHLLPKKGVALDLACGLGANAIFLAGKGLDTYAWDYSAVAIDHLCQVVQSQALNITAEVRDVEVQPPEPGRFDVIVVQHFLVRDLIPSLIAALNTNGLIFYQTFIRDKTLHVGPQKDAYLLAENELLTLFRSLNLIVYREEGLIGDIKRGFRNEAMLVARRR